MKIEKSPEAFIAELKKSAKLSIEKGKFEYAMATISVVAELMYHYNQSYTDIELEENLLKISSELIEPSKSFKNTNKTKTVLFYDGFGLDTRGVALVYMKGIVQNGYHVIYVTNEQSRNKQNSLVTEMKEFSVEWIYIDMKKSYMQWVKQLFEIFEGYKPDVAFFYTTPWDVAGTVVFNAYKDIVFRYQLDLTDHAFWLGKNAFDICVGGRDYSACISHYYRGIPVSKMIKLDANLYINQNVEFQGLPFDTTKEKFIFSGGALYKTLGDSENKFYKIIEHILVKHENIRFVYAGCGDDTELKKLIDRFDERVIHLSERLDFYQIMEKCVFYLNTYPMFGGLMMRYAANAGKLPITLKHENDSDGILINQSDLGIEYDTYEELINDVDRLLEDGNYLRDREKLLKGSVVSETCFVRNIRKLIEHKETEFTYNVEYIDTSMFLLEYKNKFEFERIKKASITRMINRVLVLRFPQYYMQRIIDKIRNVFMKLKRRKTNDSI